MLDDVVSFVIRMARGCSSSKLRVVYLSLDVQSSIKSSSGQPIRNPVLNTLTECIANEGADNNMLGYNFSCLSNDSEATNLQQHRFALRIQETQSIVRISLVASLDAESAPSAVLLIRACLSR